MSKKQWILIIALVLLVAAAFTAACIVIVHNKKSSDGFTPPAFDQNAVAGAPEGVKGFRNFSTENYVFGLCGILPQYDKNKIDVYFASASENGALLKLYVLDENGTVLGETGAVRPGEYVKTLELKKPVKETSPVSLRVVSYENDTYYSMGVVTIKTDITVS